MMGERRVMQEELFYGFSLERHVPANHLLRAIDRFVDLSGIRQHLAPFYSPIGRPSIDPELLIRMLVVGYCFGIVRAAAMRGGSSEPGLPVVSLGGQRRARAIPLAGAGVARPCVQTGHAGSWGVLPVRRPCGRRSARLPPALERLDDDHASAAARAWRADVVRFFRVVVIGRRGDVQQFAGEREAGLAGGAGEQAIVADAVEAARQDVEQEAADELVGRRAS